MILTVILPDQSRAALDVADGLLVWDGYEFKAPQDAYYLGLYSVPVEAVSAEHRGFPGEAITTYVSLRTLVVDRNSQQVTATDPSVIVQLDPLQGECLCGITCGTEIRYAQVYYMED